LPASTIISGVEFLVINESYPTNLLSSCGYLKKKEKAFIISKCAEEKKYPRILVGHYPLYEKNAFLRVRHRLWGQKKVLELLRSGKIDISLCGHVHYPYCGLDSEGRGEICAGSVTRNSCMAEIKYNGDDNSFSYKKIDLGVILRKKGTK
jgi:Icc-related predicted phosphoesterase